MSSRITPSIDPKRYARVLRGELPRPIRSDRELEKAIARLDDLDRRDRELSPEERELAELYTAPIEAYEDRHFPVPHVSPENLLRALMDRRDSHSRRSPICWAALDTPRRSSGNRSIGKAQAKRLAAFFNVPADSFIRRPKPNGPNVSPEVH